MAVAEAKGVSIDRLAAAERAAIHPALKGSLADVFSLDKAMRRRPLEGSPGADLVREQLARWKKVLDGSKRR